MAPVAGPSYDIVQMQYSRLFRSFAAPFPFLRLFRTSLVPLFRSSTTLVNFETVGFSDSKVIHGAPEPQQNQLGGLQNHPNPVPIQFKISSKMVASMGLRLVSVALQES